MATVALATTAPEGSVTCPRKVPLVVAVDGGFDDTVEDRACAAAGATKPMSAAVIRIVKIKLARVKTDKYFNAHLILSRQMKLFRNVGTGDMGIGDMG